MIGFLHNNKHEQAIPPSDSVVIVRSDKTGEDYVIMPLKYISSLGEGQVGYVSFNDAHECIEDIKTFLNVDIDRNMVLTIDGCPIKSTIQNVFGSYKTTPYKKIYNMVQEACLTKGIDTPGWFEVKYSSE